MLDLLRKLLLHLADPHFLLLGELRHFIADEQDLVGNIEELPA